MHGAGPMGSGIQPTQKAVVDAFKDYRCEKYREPNSIGGRRKARKPQPFFLLLA